MRRITKGRKIGAYTLVEGVGRGGMGDVFLAWHPELERTVAIKVLKREVASEPSLVTRFRREGKLIAQLDHPGIARVFDLGYDAGLHYIVMEFIQGRNLQQIVEEEGPLSPERALLIARQVAEALDHAHGAGIVHRDVKPSNIILSDDGVARLTDFGVARLGEQETVLTRAGDILGSPVYMSPEHVRGADGVDARSDLYSLGATLYVLLSGELPFPAETLAATVHRIVHTQPRPLETLVPELPPPVVGIVKRLMAKLPAARFQTGRELRGAIDEALRSPRSRPRGSPLATGTPATGSALRSRAVAGLLVLCAVVAGLLFHASDPRGSSADSGAVASPTIPRQDHTIDEPLEHDGRPLAESPERADERARLEERLLAFRDAILSGSERRALGFVDPSVRANSGLLRSLRHIVEIVEGMGSGVSTHHTLDLREDRAEAVFFFQQEESSSMMKFPVAWIRRDGSWYAAPEGADPGR